MVIADLLVFSATRYRSVETDCAPVAGPQFSGSNIHTWENDCAPVKAVPFSCAKVATQAMRLAPDLHLDSLPHGFTLAISPWSPSGPVVLNPPAFERLQQFARPRPPEQAVDFTLAGANILLPEGYKPQLQPPQPTTLTAWLHITNACNLDCPYCYIRKSNRHMSVKAGRQVIDSIFDSALKHRFQAIKLKYAGGEAALHFGLVQHLHSYAQQLAIQHNLDLRAVVLSNGTLWTPGMAGWLKENRVKLMISLDGVGKTHNQLRPTRGGKGSFTAIERVVDTVLLPNGIHPDISITISGKNATTAADAVEWAIIRDLPLSLNFYRENPASRKFKELQIEETQIIAGMRRAYQVVEKHLPHRSFINGLLDRVQMDAHQHTCGVGQNYLVFSHTGAAAQCQMQLADNMIISHHTDPLNGVRNGAIPVIDVEQKTGCKTCPWRFRCSGGCPLETYRATGRFDVKSPHCTIYKTLLPHALRLEGLRLMKVGGVLE